MRSLAIIPILGLTFLVACPEQEVKGDDTGADDTGADPTYEMEVVADGGSATVNLYDLDTSDFEGDTVVAVTAVLEASGLSVTWEERTYDFVASDGFTPSSRDCEPVDYSTLQNAYFYRESGNLVWDAAIEQAGCYFVDNTVTVDVQDAE
jgi:hypothetical protein